MMQIESLIRKQVRNTALMDEILLLDQENMKPIFEKLGQEMPIERRKAAFDSTGTIIIAKDDAGFLAGYLEYGPGWNDPTEIYLSSIQIAKKHQNSMLLLLLMRHAMADTSFVCGQTIRIHVQKSNEFAISICKRLGFNVDESSDRNGTLMATMAFPPKWPNTRPPQDAKQPAHEGKCRITHHATGCPVAIIPLIRTVAMPETLVIRSATPDDSPAYEAFMVSLL